MSLVSPSEHRRKWHFEVLEICRSLVGLPTLAVLASEIFWKDDGVVIGTVTAVALAIAVALRFLPERRFVSNLKGRQFFLTTLPWLLSAVLVVVIVLIVIPRRVKAQNDLLTAAWLSWQKSLDKSAAECNANDPGHQGVFSRLRRKVKQPKLKTAEDTAKEQKAISACLAEELAPILRTRPGRENSNQVPGLATDLLAGQLMLANSQIRDTLWLRFSTDQRFLGSGVSEPRDKGQYTEARIPEYLVPNLSDQSQRVWMWKLDPWQHWPSGSQTKDQVPIMNQKLLKVLMGRLPDNHSGFKEFWGFAQHQASVNSTPLILVRFGRLSAAAKYSGCLGRADATRVFMSDMEKVKDMTVHDAGNASGYPVAAKFDESKEPLFIWVYAPLNEGQVVRATWGYVLDNFAQWITEDGCIQTPAS